jgi:hypothetical protein
MIGFINDARGQRFLAEANIALRAAQLVNTELVGNGAATANTLNGILDAGTPAGSRITGILAPDAITHTDIVALRFSTAPTEEGRITGIVYRNSTADPRYWVKIEVGTSSEVTRVPSATLPATPAMPATWAALDWVP